MGRDQALSELREALSDSGSRLVTVYALRGLGGVGKTQIAIEYVYRHAADYGLVGWIDAENPALIAAQVAALADSVGVTSTSDAQVTAATVVAALAGRKDWLLVFDNAEQPGDITAFLPRGAGHVIATSRNAGWGALGTTVDVDVFSRAESVRLLSRRCRGIQQSVAQDIAGHLGDLALAIEQAAAYLETTGIAPGTYLELLQTRGDELLARSEVAGRRHTVATVWDVSFTRLEQINPAAARLLRLCAWLAPDPIPLDLFARHPDELPQPLATAAADTLSYTDAVGAIISLSLARRDHDAITVHRLVSAATRHALADEQRPKM